MEIWKDIEGYNGKYQVSNLGNIRSFSRWAKGRILKGGVCGTKGKSGPYRYVILVKSSRADAKNVYIHRLVALHFVDNPNGYNEINHKDGNTLNNCADNLEWCTHFHNMHHAIDNGLIDISHDFERGARHPKAKSVIQKTKDGKFVKEWESVNQVQRETKYLASCIFNCCNHKHNAKTAYGYLWEYKDG